MALFKSKLVSGEMKELLYHENSIIYTVTLSQECNNTMSLAILPGSE